ncbi:MerR family transcriptional regulator [Streptomyces qinglanensis]|uniref:MerR HTH family regulatory protein n=1 Tax=Streptomyces qinglanensis TaxID=943816 RepID=A0A1H9RJJ5_9ACTN|nr:MerR family transcriptional regulator [Streptomyces qinglanensis]SER72119.1 MerR HTH family regulatory protein [Streptomyces qinglanensis]
MTSTGGEGTAAGDSSLLGGPVPASGREAPPGRPCPAPSSAGAVGAVGDAPSEQVGYRGPTACSAAGITYRQLDYWARTGLVEPSIRPAYGSGSQRLYSFRDIVVLKIVKRLLDTGVSLQNIRAAVRHLRSGGRTDLARMTLMSDGATVYECSSPDEVVDLLQGGQGVFGIAVGVVWKDVEGALSRLHGERVDTGETLVRDHPEDELARRRNRAG